MNNKETPIFNSKHLHEYDHDDTFSEEDDSQGFRPPPRRRQTTKKKPTTVKHEALYFLPIPSQRHISIKKLGHLSRTKEYIENLCYIPEKNRLLTLSKGPKRRVNVYNTINFSLIATVISKTPLSSIRYCPRLNTVLASTINNFIQVWSPITLKTEAESPEKMVLCNINLHSFERVSTPIDFGDYSPSEIFRISKNCLLIPCSHDSRKVLTLFDLRTRAKIKYKDIKIPDSSCVKMTEDTPTKVFTCLTEQFPSVWNTYKLTQFTIHPKTKDPAVMRKTVSEHSFIALSQKENSKYFLAKARTETGGSQDVLLSIDKEKIEMIKIIPEPWFDLSSSYLMLKDGFSVIKRPMFGKVSVYSLKIHRDKEKRAEQDFQK